MKILVAAATPIEISPFLKQLREDPLLFSNTDVLITGIGLTATTYTLSKQFQIYKPDLVIQAGVGGCFDKTKPLGTVVAVKQETIADQSVIEINQLKTLFDLKLIPHNQFPYRNGWLINKNELLKNIKLQKVKGISVNEITTSRKKMIFYEKHFSPVVESMEGAALHYTCLMENIPFIQIRAMSNYIAERNKKKWNMKESVDNLNKELVKTLKNINS
ncbi:MAG TPA: futalosine hydrolase [Chitinophagaceae bacterium]|jgi:futalosine hydrolase|nr:futalosine hydrolase [Chitinophagaceae bacterium]HMU59139.1 futalosine hydrolase [Chitinophagaceae bacterium]